MDGTLTTKEKLLMAGRQLFWTRGYSNVSVRDITKLAGVDAALVSRYFGGKLGLFEATLASIPNWNALTDDNMLEAAVESFSEPYNPEIDHADPFKMLLANVIDPEMGPRIKALFEAKMSTPLAKRLGGPDAEARAAMLLASLFGMALMRKCFHLPVLTEARPEETAAKTRLLAMAAVEYKG